MTTETTDRSEPVSYSPKPRPGVVLAECGIDGGPLDVLRAIRDHRRVGAPTREAARAIVEWHAERDRLAWEPDEGRRVAHQRANPLVSSGGAYGPFVYEAAGTRFDVKLHRLGGYFAEVPAGESR